MKYPLASIRCGDDKFAGLWISVGYSSNDGEQKVLHIVGGEEKTARPVGRSLVPIYYEGCDQSLSCYEAADEIRVTCNSISLTLNKNGRDSLDLPKHVEFIAKKSGKDFKKALKVFVEIRERHGGEVINLVKS